MTKFNIFCILVSVLALTVLIVDYCCIDEFKMEGIFLLTATTVLVFNVVRHSNRILWGKFMPGLLSNVLIAALLVYGFVILSLFLFGYGFTGRNVQPIWMIMAICTVFLFILIWIDIHYLLLKRQKGG